MKNTLLFLLCCLLCSATRADHASYEKLAEVNRCWTEQKDIPALPAYTGKSEKEWIRLHLSLVEQTLRGREQPQLSTEQKANRAQCLDILHRYWQEGNFPINDQYTKRTPIFIDKYNNFCAVGFLLKETGFETVSRKISAQTNLAYVRQMNYPELGDWATQFGFSIDELAWIQPSYPPQTSLRRLGAGVDGIVQELYVDEASEKMYVGGSFINADGSLTANNIAFVTEASGVYTWHSLGAGVNGKVNAITKFDDKIFVAGSFNAADGKAAGNVAYWNGSEWTAAGCVDGTVYDLLVFEGALYAAGEFKSCGAGAEGNFAKWDGTDWTMIEGIDGRINTMEANGSSIVLGGAFSYDTVIKAVQWSAATSFIPFGNSIKNEVMDFEHYKDALYAACKRASKADTNEMLLKLTDALLWEQGFTSKHEEASFDAKEDGVAFHTLCTEGTALNIGGAFNYLSMVYGANCYNMGGSSRKWSIVDSTVNKMVLFKGEVYFGGLFRNGSEFSEAIGERDVKGLNGIAKRADVPLSVPQASTVSKELRIFPNPATGNSFVSVANNFNADRYTLYEHSGKIIESGQLQGNSMLRVPPVAAGVYFLNLGNSQGQMQHSKIIVQ